MHRSLILALALCCPLAPVWAHALFPGRQIVSTAGERAFVRFQAVNDRSDVAEFAIEIYENDSWVPSRLAVPLQSKLVVPSRESGSADSSDRSFAILVDLDGKPQQQLRVCTRSVSRNGALRPQLTLINTRVCASVLVKRL